MLWLGRIGLALESLIGCATADVRITGIGCDSDGVEGLRHAVLGALLGDSYAWRGQGPGRNLFRNQQQKLFEEKLFEHLFKNYETMLPAAAIGFNVAILLVESLGLFQTSRR